MAASFTKQMASLILKGEDSPTRFERFCCQLFSAVDGIRYVPTSRTYDLGCDGRDVQRGQDSARHVICASTQKTVLDKAQQDASTLEALVPAPTTIRFCSNQPLTENMLADIRGQFSASCPDSDQVRADGLYQLEQLAVENPNVLEEAYAGELANLRQALGVSRDDAGEVEITGLRIALTTQLSDDASELREDLQKNLVLSALSSDEPRTVGHISKTVSDLLHLPRLLDDAYVESAIAALRADGVVTEDGGRWAITEAGRRELEERTERGTGRLSEVQNAVKQEIAELSGADIAGATFSRLWQVFVLHPVF